MPCATTRTSHGRWSSGALVIAFMLYKSIKSESTKKLVDLIFTVSTVACIYVNMAQLISFTGVEGAFWMNLWR